MTSGWHDLDKLAALVVFVCAWLGLWRGATRTVVGLVALAAGIALAAVFGAEVGDAVTSGRSALEPFAPLIGSSIVYGAVLIFGAFVARVARRRAEERSFGAIDRVFGLVLGTGRGIGYVAVAMIALRTLPLDSLHAASEHTVALGVTRTAFELVEPVLPTKMTAWVGDALIPTR